MGRRLPPINAMRVFEAAGRHLSFTKAADELHVTQAAVSHQIKALEEWLGVMLFQRLNRGLKLTDEGQEYLGPLTEAFDLMGGATAKLMDQDNVKTLSVSTLSSFASIWLLPRLKKFRDRYPDLNVHLVTSRQETDMLLEGDVDLDIRYGEGRWQHMQADLLLEETLFPVCSPELLAEAPLSKPADIAKHTLLHDVMNVGWSDWFDHVGLEDQDASRGPTFSNSQLVMQAALNGEGIALGRDVLVADAIARGDLVRPFADSLPCQFSYYMVSAKNTSDQHKIRVFKKWLSAEADGFNETLKSQK